MAKKTTSAVSTDEKTLDLIKEVNRRKEEIAQLGKPSWSTNCSFCYAEGKLTDPINLHVESKVSSLVSIAGHLLSKEDTYNRAAGILGVEVPPFTWQTFRVQDWLSDIQLRINQLQISNKQKSLSALEERLNKVISPALRAELELQEIQDELLGDL